MGAAVKARAREFKKNLEQFRKGIEKLLSELPVPRQIMMANDRRRRDDSWPLSLGKHNRPSIPITVWNVPKGYLGSKLFD